MLVTLNKKQEELSKGRNCNNEFKNNCHLKNRLCKIALAEVESPCLFPYRVLRHAQV